MSTETEIKTYENFDEYYSDANALVRSKHDDFHVFRFSEIGDQIVTKMGPFRKNYFHFVIANILHAKVDVFDSSTLTETHTLVIYLPGQLVQWEKTGEWNGYLINVKESFLRGERSSNFVEVDFLNSLQPLVMNINQEDYEQLSTLYELMIEEHNAMEAENIIVIKNLLQVLMIFINRLVSKSESTTEFVELKYQKLASRFKSLVFAQYYKNREVGYYADLLSITPTYLLEVTKKVYGETPKDIINKIVFLHAKTLLCSTDITIKELAWSLKFDDYSHFVKFFKKMSGQTPAAYRKKGCA